MDEKIKTEYCHPEPDVPTVVSEKGVLLRTSARVSKKLRMTPASTSPGPSCSKIGLYIVHKVVNMNVFSLLMYLYYLQIQMMPQFLSPLKLDVNFGQLKILILSLKV